MTIPSDSRLVVPPEAAPLSVARRQERVPTTAASPEQVDLVYALRVLVDSIPPMLPQVIMGEMRPGGWSDLADILYRAARLCREQVVLESDG
jgi:hypothetical protein